MDKYEKLKSIIKTSKKIVVFSGAGISTCHPTNIKDFRSTDGLYNQKTSYGIKPEEIISHSFFMRNPKEFYEFYFDKMVFKDAKYNLCHKYFSSLDNCVAVITQNIDNLHQSAGSKNVLELHGSVFRNYCMKCNKFYHLNDLNLDRDGIPICDCGGMVKPDVVLYEEQLNQSIIKDSINFISSCDTLIVVGTSLTVYPAAGFLQYFNGENLIVINKQETQYDSKANLVFNEDMLEVIKKLQI